MFPTKNILSKVSHSEELKFAETKYNIRWHPSRNIYHKDAHCSMFSHLNTHLQIRGLFNLLVIIVVVQNARLILENFIKYGIRIKLFSLPKNIDDLVENWPLLLSFLLMHVFFFAAYAIEKYLFPLASKLSFWIIDFVTHLVSVLNAAMILYIPYVAVAYSESEAISATVLLALSIVWFLKLISFHSVLNDVRRSLNDGEKYLGFIGADSMNNYPSSLNFREYYLFLLMPTMCYQFEYPRNEAIRWIVVFRHFIELIVCVILSLIIIQQYILILLENIQRITESSSRIQILMHILERTMKLSIPNLIIWLLMFMAIFHHWLNLLSELTRFADRRFYEDWWNSENIGEYWRKWNLPIHNFVSRHIYQPLTLQGKLPKMLAGQIVFLLSALAHEYLVCVPLHLKFKGIIFSGFVLQMPLMLLTTSRLFQSHRTLGNVTFWILFCFTGQPLAIIIYYYLWAIKNNMIASSSWLENILVMKI